MALKQVAERKARAVSELAPATLTTRNEQANEISAAGDFNDWDPKGIPLAKNSLGEWRADFKLRPGEYQYRLRVDGQWQDHPEALTRVPNPFGTENCVLTVP